jgi:hypothetical protein
LQLRPSFEHIDKVYEKQKDLKSRIDAEEDRELGLPELEEEAKLIQVPFLYFNLVFRSRLEREMKPREALQKEKHLMKHGQTWHYTTKMYP